MAVEASIPLFCNEGGGVDWMEDGSFPSNFYQPYQHQQQQRTTGWFPSLPPPSTTTVALPSHAVADRHLSMDESLKNLLEKQRNEMDQYILLQNNRLRAALYLQRKHHMAALLQSLESKASFLLIQKESELAKARKRTMELEACIKTAEVEKERWRTIARENEAIAVSLNHTLKQVQDSCFSSTGGYSPETEASASCSGNPLVVEERSAAMGLCKVCGSRELRVLLLPCRHLCACDLCEAFLDACPLCGCVKEASVEVSLV